MRSSAVWGYPSTATSASWSSSSAITTSCVYRKYLTVDPARLFDTHGRGILMAGNLFELEYVDPGNEVQVTLRFAR